MTDEIPDEVEYSSCMDAMNEHITRDTDGIFVIDMAGFPWGRNEEIMQDLHDSILITNDMIRSGEVNPADIEC